MRLRRGSCSTTTSGRTPRRTGWRLLDPPRGSPGDPRLARAAIAPPLAGEACQPGGAHPLRQAPAAPSAGRGVVGRRTGCRWATRSSSPRAGLLARARESAPLAEILARVLPRAERYLVKVTWHGYAPGTYTGPAGAGPPARRTARPGGRAGGAHEQPERGRCGHRLGNRRRAAPRLDPAAGRRIPAADRAGGGDRPARGPVPERDRGVVGRRVRRPRTFGPRSGTSRSGHPELAGFVPVGS